MSAPTPEATEATVGGARPATLFLPPRESAAPQPLPLVVMLHAYGVNGEFEELAFQLRPVAAARSFLYVHPDGTPNDEGKRFWNATDACCGGAKDSPDDVSYLRGLVGEIASKYPVDRKRVYLVGHSNGAFMAHRMACESPELFAAVVSIAGATFADASKCKPSAPVAVLEVHGTADGTIKYEGGAFFGHAYPSATTTVERWAGFDGCAKEPKPGDRLDLDAQLPGADTRVLRWSDCRPGGAVELWTIDGGKHIPTPTQEFRRDAVDFLLAHPKP